MVQWRYNRRARWSEYVWWLCAFYLLGSVCFVFAAASSFPGNGLDDAATDWLVNAPRLLGSVAFLFGAWISVVMWKIEQFGLGFINEINHFEPTSTAGGSEPSRVDVKQQVFLMVYVALGVLSAVDTSASVANVLDILDGGLRAPYPTASPLPARFSLRSPPSAAPTPSSGWRPSSIGPPPSRPTRTFSG